MIYNYIAPSIILDVDNYNGDVKVHTFNDVLFRTEVCENFYNFHTPIAVKDEKIISISNKQLSFLIHRYRHYIGDNYGQKLQQTYHNLINNREIITIEEPVFHFFDYESISGTGHSYDLMFYLLYQYSLHNLKCKLLVVNSDNTYYNTLLQLIKKYYHIDYVYIDVNKNYLLKNFNCVRTYQNVFFKEVKTFIHNTLIHPIMESFSNHPYYSIISKIKVKDVSSIDRLNSSFLLTDLYASFCKTNNIFDINEINDEEYKIYLLNKANKIIITWGSNYYININYYISDYSEKFISIIFHNSILSELDFVRIMKNTIIQNIPDWATGGYNDQIYKSCSFQGEIISNIHTLDEFVQKTKLLTI